MAAGNNSEEASPFAFADELKDKRRQLREVDDDLTEAARQDAIGANAA